MSLAGRSIGTKRSRKLARDREYQQLLAAARRLQPGLGERALRRHVKTLHRQATRRSR